MRLVKLSLLCLAGALAFHLETRFELARRAVTVPAQPDAVTQDPPRGPESTVPALVPRALTFAAIEEGPASLGPRAEIASEEGDGLAILSGVVVGANGSPLPSAWVVAQAEGCDGCEPLEVEVDSDGRFTVEVTPGTWTLVARADEAIASEARGLTVAGGETLDGLRFTLAKGKVIRGRVFAEGEPIDGAAVYLEGNGYRLTAVTEGGAFEFSGLPSGRYHLTAWLQDWGGDARDVEAGGSATLTLRSHTVSGLVIDPSGQPAVGAQVLMEARVVSDQEGDHDPFGPLPATAELYDPCEYGACPMAITDEDGAFELDLPIAATIHLNAWDMEGRRAILNDVSPNVRRLTMRLQDPRETRVRVVSLEGSSEELYELYVRDVTPTRARPAPEVAIIEEGVATLFTFDGIPVNVEVPAGARVEPIDPLPPEVLWVAPQDDGVDQLMPIHPGYQLAVEL